MKNKVEDLRDHLFETIEMLKDKDNPIEIERAKAIAQVGQTIIESAKAEVKFLETVGGKAHSNFFPTEDGRPAQPHFTGTNSK